MHGRWVVRTTKKEAVGDAVIEAVQLFEKEDAKDKPPEYDQQKNEGASTQKHARFADVPEPTIDRGAEGSAFEVANTPVNLALPGRYNGDNALAALAGLEALGVPWRDGVGALSGLRPSPLRGAATRCLRV